MRLLAFFFLFSVGTFAGVSPDTNIIAFSQRILPETPVERANFGARVAIASNVVVFGLRPDVESKNNILAHVYRRAGDTLTPDGSLPAPALTNLTIADLATDGQRIVFAAAEDKTPAIYIFTRGETQWTLETLSPNERIDSIAMQNGTIVAGGGSKLRLYERLGSDWNETLINPPPNFRGAFGRDVALDDDTILVGAPGDPRGYSGGAYVFIREGNTWQFQAELPGDFSVLFSLGRLVALDGNTALLASDGGRFDSGFVEVWERSAATWQKTGALGGEDGGGDFFGESIAISGRNMVVGAPSARAGPSMYLFRRNSRDDRQPFDKVRLYDFVSGLGYAVAIDGDTIVGGAPYHNAGASDSGAGVIFRLKFPATLQSPVARFADEMFSFTVIEAEVGATYVLEKKTDIAANDWSSVKEFTAENPDLQIATELSVESGAELFRVRRKEAPTAATETNSTP